MSVGVLLLTHEGMGATLITTARQILGRMPASVDAYDIPLDADVASTFHAAAARARALDSGSGVLVLTDLYGATPSNIAEKLAGLGIHLHRVSGLNLPMLLRVLNYPEQTLNQLTQTAASGGRGGIYIDHA